MRVLRIYIELVAVVREWGCCMRAELVSIGRIAVYRDWGLGMRADGVSVRRKRFVQARAVYAWQVPGYPPEDGLCHRLVMFGLCNA